MWHYAERPWEGPLVLFPPFTFVRGFAVPRKNSHNVQLRRLLD
jgi:hypothetical protein